MLEVEWHICDPMKIQMVERLKSVPVIWRRWMFDRYCLTLVSLSCLLLTVNCVRCMTVERAIVRFRRRLLQQIIVTLILKDVLTVSTAKHLQPDANLASILCVPPQGQEADVFGCEGIVEHIPLHLVVVPVPRHRLCTAEGERDYLYIYTYI